MRGRAGWLVAGLLVAAYAHNVALGWLTWGDVAGDTGRELEFARRLAGGERLYVDVTYYYGPLAPHLNALLFRLFGARLEVLMAAGLVAAALACAGVVAIVWRLAGAVTAAAAGLAFLYCCAFPHLHYANVFNWVVPYGFAATYGMLAAVWSVERLLRHLETGRTAALVASCGLLALAALTKTEAVVAATAAHAAFLAGRLAGVGRFASGTAGAYGGAVALVGAVWGGVLLGADVPARLRESIVQVAAHPGMQAFLRTYAGLADPSAGAFRAAVSVLALGACVGVAVVASVLVRRRALGPPLATAPAAAIAFAVGVALGPSHAFAALPRLGLGVAATLAVAIGTRADDRDALLPETVLWAAALACLARIPLAAGMLHYGFYLMPLPLAAFAVWWARRLPAWLGLADDERRPHAWIGAALLAGIAAGHLRVSLPLFAAHTVRVDAPRGRIRLLADLNGFPIGRAWADTIAHLATYPPATRVMVVPTGAALPFLAGLAPAGDRTGYAPPEYPPEAERRLLQRFATDPPDLVVSIRLDLSEWGSRGFGVDYARPTWTWLVANYEPVATFGPQELVLVLRRRR